VRKKKAEPQEPLAHAGAGKKKGKGGGEQGGAEQ
jgi:hypothetical protein